MEKDESSAHGNAAHKNPVTGVLTPRRWGEYLIAILGGNIIYLFIEPQLPTVMRHRMFRVDLGLGIDFLICVTAYGLVRLFAGYSENRG